MKKRTRFHHTPVTRLLIPLLMLLLSGCGNGTRDVETYGDIYTSPGGIQITSASEHQAGWGRRDCLVCHNLSLNVHRHSGSNIDASTLNELARANGGSAYCLTCHGPNGLPD